MAANPRCPRWCLVLLACAIGPALAARAGAAVSATPAPTRAAPLADLISMLPKAELHIHVEGTLEPDLMLKIAARNGVSLPYKNLAQAKAARTNYTDLQGFLDVYNEAMSVLRTEADYYELLAAYLARAAAQNIRHAEIFFDAQSHPAGFGVFMPGFHRAVTEAQAKYGMTLQLILCFVRNLPEAAAAKTLLQSLPYRLQLSTVGLASAELGNPPEKFENVYRAAKIMGLHRVAHAGEEGGPDYVWGAIKDLGVERIDHGIHSLEDPELIAYMKEHHIAVTLCPISNKQLQVYKGEIEGKLREMVASGVTVALSSDDPAFFGAYVNENYAWVADVANLSGRQVADLAKQSFEASFLSAAEKMEYWSMVDEAYAKWERAGGDQQLAVSAS